MLKLLRQAGPTEPRTTDANERQKQCGKKNKREDVTVQVKGENIPSKQINNTFFMQPYTQQQTGVHGKVKRSKQNENKTNNKQKIYRPIQQQEIRLTKNMEE